MQSPIDQTPVKGRPTKKKGFKGTHRKLYMNKDEVRRQDSHIDLTVTPSTDVRHSSIPVGLENEGVNVCFFNSVVQVLYSLPSFRSYILQTSVINEVTAFIRNLFQEIKNARESVWSSYYIRNLGLRNYKYGTQDDAHECLTQLLEKCYPDNVDNSMFQVAMHESTVCQIIGDRPDTGCNNNCAENDVLSQVLALDIDDNTDDDQSIQELINKLVDPHGKELPDYRCENCNKRGFCTISSSITHIADVLIIQLIIFQYIGGTTRKVIPSFIIDNEIRVFDDLTLQGIIWHHGYNANCGHYTSSVIADYRWFSISDTDVHEGQRFHLSLNNYTVPYILVYKKRNDLLCPLPLGLNGHHDIACADFADSEFMLKELNTQEERKVNAEKMKWRLLPMLALKK